MRPTSGISSPARPVGYPVPSQRSWWVRAITSAICSSGDGEPVRISAPIDVWVSIASRSSGVKRPGLSRIASGIPILPTSCSTLACWSRSASSSDMPLASASRRQRMLIRSMCSPVSWSRDSAAWPRRRMSSSWVSRISSVASRTRCFRRELTAATIRRSRASVHAETPIVPTAASPRATSGATNGTTTPWTKASWHAAA